MRYIFQDKKTNTFFLIGIILFAIALVIRISDNPLGIALAYDLPPKK